MDKKKLQNLSKPIVDVYMGIEEQILVNIAKKIAKDKRLLDEIEKGGEVSKIESWQLLRLNDLNTLTEENLETLSQYSGKAIEEITKMLEEAGYSAVQETEDDLQEGAEKGVLRKAPPVEESTALQDVLVAFDRQAKDRFNLINTTMLEQSQQVYLDIINRTTGEVLAGVSTPQEALRKTASEWAEKGMPVLEKSNGARMYTEGYVSMITRSMSNNIANDMQDARMDEYGNDLVEVSSHSGARPKCAPYQGRIYSRSGNHPKYPALASTSIGEPDGLFGVHCGHIKYPFIEGVSKRTYKPRDPETNDRQYENSQKQRYLERRIRDAKREMRMMEAMEDSKGLETAKRKVLDRQANMRGFIKSTNRTRQYDREQIY
ncbi:phage minor capsid protein [Sediminibacillus massiliensis]|uniref:phage minor capsid protein n=1 Tax=Sediminibacillus massiliensis TaxID=1926277 RepID=UPI00098832E2|nr:phage minor capsid protein [Sediminibacillus massiliensis]